MPKKKSAQLTVRVQRLAHSANLPLPAYQSDGAAGLDLLAAVEEQAPIVLKPGQRALIPTGLVLEIPAGFEGQVRPRSGLALKHGVTVLNSPGTIDSDYRGEVKVLVVNLGDEAFAVRRGERVAQLVVACVITAKLSISEALSATRRGAGGFGSTSPKRTARKINPGQPIPLKLKSSRQNRKSAGRRKAARGK